MSVDIQKNKALMPRLSAEGINVKVLEVNKNEEREERIDQKIQGGR